jgi:hypothetical protein
MHAQPTNELRAARDCGRRQDSASPHEKAADGRALPIDGPDHVVCVTRTSAQRLIATEKWLSLEAVNAGARYGAKHGVRQACRMFKPE